MVENWKAPLVTVELWLVTQLSAVRSAVSSTVIPEVPSLRVMSRLSLWWAMAWMEGGSV